MKYTKGKWRIGSSGLSIIDGKKIVAYVGSRDVIPIEEQYANALLISKAPKMLDMLESVKGYLGSDQRNRVEQLIKQATEL